MSRQGPRDQEFTNGAAHVAEVGRAGQSHNRFIDDVAETQATMGHMTWTVAEGVYAVRFKIELSAGAVVQGDEVRVVFDASPVDDITNDTQAWAWLQTPSSAPATDVEYFPLEIGGADIVTDKTYFVPAWSEWFYFSNPLRRADFHYPNGTAGSVDVKIFAEVA